MAVGKKGGFATVSQAPVYDFGQMIRNAQAEQSRLGKTEVAYVADYEKQKQEIAGSILQLDPKEGHFKETQQILGEWFSQYQDMLATNEKNIAEAKFGEMSLGQLRGISAGINSKVGKIKQNMDRLSKADVALFEANVSDGISGSVFDMISGLHTGKGISGAGVDEETLEPYMTYKSKEGEMKMGLEKIIDFMYNPPKNIKYGDMVTAYGTAFKADKRSFRQGNLDITKQQLDKKHKARIEDDADKLLADEKNFNSIVYNTFAKKDVHTIDQLKATILERSPESLEGLGEIESFDDIPDEKAIEILRDTFVEKTFNDVGNMVGETYTETPVEVKTDGGDDDKPVTKSTFVETAVPDLNFYDNVFGGASPTLQGMRTAISVSDVKKGYNFTTPISVSNISGYEKGNPKAVNNAIVFGAIETNDGRIALNIGIPTEQRYEEGEALRAAEGEKGGSTKVQLKSDVTQQTSILLTEEDSAIFKANHLQSQATGVTTSATQPTQTYTSPSGNTYQL